MTDIPVSAQQALELARAALQRGERSAARQWAGRAAQLDPTLEDPWLILAAIANPKAGIQYLQHALDINPNSARAQKGMEWVKSRLDQHTPPPPAQASSPTTRIITSSHPPSTPPLVPASSPSTQRLNKRSAAPTKQIPSAAAIPIIRVKTRQRSRSHQGLMTLTGAILGILLAAILLVSLGIGYKLASPLLVQEGLGRPQDSAVVLQIPTQTATFPPTLTPLQPEPTSAPTETLPDVPVATATIELPAPVEIATPTQTPVPTKTKKVVMPPPGVGPGERWIDIDLSKQKTYAYQGGELVNIFRVSTGTWQHPTVTGIFRIYIKYRSQTMYGEDYYLPNVPYVMYFYEDYGLHGTYWHNNFGTPMSHGCINLKTGDAGWLYDWASVGTVVNVHP